MPYSLVFHLVPRSPIFPNFLSGRHLHALFLTLVNSVDRDLGEKLHNQNTQKAFTLSLLQVETAKRSRSFDLLQWEHRQAIAAGTPCWWRVSLLDDRLFGHLRNLWLNLNPSQPWHLGSADLDITRILGTPQPTQPWVDACSYRELFDRASDKDRDLCFQFATPTAFRQGKYDTALPTPESVFKGLISKWNRYSEMELFPSLIDPLFPSFFDIRTQIIADSRSKFIGCVGQMNFRILGDVDRNTIQQINAIADYSLYGGVGRKTTMGMGIVRRIKK